jgi:hypothetical protein
MNLHFVFFFLVLIPPHHILGTNNPDGSLTGDIGDSKQSLGNHHEQLHPNKFMIPIGRDPTLGWASEKEGM